MEQWSKAKRQTSYKADRADELAQHSEVHGSVRKVNDGVVQLEFAFLSGEACSTQRSRKEECVQGSNALDDRAGVSRGHSTAEVMAGRPEPVECSSTAEPQSQATIPNGEACRLVDPDGKHGGTQDDLLERILSRENLFKAWKRVKTNGGSAAIDKMSVDQFPSFARHHWGRIRSAIMQGTYHPAKVRRVMIPKATGGQRPLGIPTVMDRVIQQTIAQVILPLFEPFFSDSSYGLRPRRRAHDAVAEMKAAWTEKVRYAVDCDLKSFFDTVNHRPVNESTGHSNCRS